MRVEKRILLGLADGSTLTLDRGDCWIDEDGENPTLIWRGADGLESAPITVEQMGVHLRRKDFVFTSW